MSENQRFSGVFRAPVSSPPPSAGGGGGGGVKNFNVAKKVETRTFRIYKGGESKKGE